MSNTKDTMSYEEAEMSNEKTLISNTKDTMLYDKAEILYEKIII